MEDFNKGIEIIVRPDGVYLMLSNLNGASKPPRGEVLRVIETYGVQDINFSAIRELYQSEEAEVEAKISNNTNINQEPERVTIQTDSDGLAAYIRFVPPVNMGKRATLEDIQKAVIDAGIRHGIIEGMVEHLAIERSYNNNYLLAKGDTPVDGKDGFLQYNFNTGPKSHRPKMMENGSVDYKSLDLYD